MSGRRTDAEREQHLAETYEKLATAVDALVEGEDWAQMLAVASRFHRYSFGNVMLIISQLGGDVTRVAGYRDWQRLGRQVRRGEHGADILAPTYRRRREDPDAARDDSPATDARQDDGKAKATDHNHDDRRQDPRWLLAGYHPVRVFDIAQTDGPPLPDIVPELLVGDAPPALYESLAAQVAAKGFTLVREDCSPANGRTDFVSRTVAVRPDLSPAQAAKTLAHELGHVALHDEEKFRGRESFMCRGLAEVEAESVAYLVCATAGLSTGDYSFPYVARWAKGDVALVRSAADRSLGAARAIAATLGLTPSLPDAATAAVLDRSTTNAAQPVSSAPSRTPAPELVR